MKTQNNGVSLTTNILGKELIKYRGLENITYEEMAKQMGIHSTTILDIRSFVVKKPEYVTAIKIISFTGISDKNRDLMLKTDYPFMYEHNQKIIENAPTKDIDKPFLYKVMESLIAYATYESADCSGIPRRRIIKIWGNHAENIVDNLIDQKIIKEENGILTSTSNEHHRNTDRTLIKQKHKYALEMIDTKRDGESSDLLTTATGGVEKKDFIKIREIALKYHQELVSYLRTCKKGNNPVFFNISFGKFTDSFNEDEPEY